MCISWCAHYMSLRNARCNDEDICVIRLQFRRAFVCGRVIKSRHSNPVFDINVTMMYEVKKNYCLNKNICKSVLDIACNACNRVRCR